MKIAVATIKISHTKLKCYTWVLAYPFVYRHHTHLIASQKHGESESESESESETTFTLRLTY